MRIEINATQKELAEKSTEVLSKLESLFQNVAPDTAEMLNKAMPEKKVELRYPVLKDLHKQTALLYQQHLDDMVNQVNKVLNRSLPKKT